MPITTLPAGSVFQARADHNPALQRFLLEADKLIEEDPQSGFERCGPLLAEVCREGAFTTLVNYELDCLLHDPDYALEGTSDTDMLVWRSPRFTLLLKLALEPQRQDRLFAQCFDLLMAPVSGTGVTVRRYRQPRPEPNDVFDRTRHLEFCAEERLLAGDSRYFKAGEDVFLVLPHPAEEPPPLIACLAASGKLPLRWEYDAGTLAPVRAVAADSSASRLQFLSWMMAAMNRHDSVPALEALLTHPAHFVRWAALQSIFRLDRDKGFHLLETALQDPHDHVRSAAQSSLAKLQAAALSNSNN